MSGQPVEDSPHQRVIEALAWVSQLREPLDHPDPHVRRAACQIFFDLTGLRAAPSWGPEEGGRR